MRSLRLLLLFSVAAIVFGADKLTLISQKDVTEERGRSKEEDQWRKEAVEKLWKERNSMGYSPLVKFPMKGFPNVDLFFKDETKNPTRTLKHRFTWALLMWAIVEGKVTRNSTVYDSTSGNTGASEAYMCTLVGLPYVAVVAKELEVEKVKQITSHGGKVMKVDVSLRNYHAQNEALKTGGYFINQFGNADKAEEYHESGGYSHESTNVFHEILNQLKKETSQKKKIPNYFVHSAGTGGTISSVGRYITRYSIPTSVVLADSENSLFYDYVAHNRFVNESGNHLWVKPGVAGIGYGYNVKPVIFGETTSLVRSVIDESVKIPDVASTAAMQVLRERGIQGGASTGLNFLVSLVKAIHNKGTSEDHTTVVTIICDPADFYESTYYNQTWTGKLFADRGGLDTIGCWKKEIAASIDTGSDFLAKGLVNCYKPKKSLVFN